jgi:hypothetical protein
LSPSFESPYWILQLQVIYQRPGPFIYNLKDFRLYYTVPVVYRSWYSPTNRRDSGVVLAIRDSYYRSSKELGYYYLIRIQDTTPDLDPILSTRLGTLASYRIALLLVPLEFYIPFPRLIVLIAEAPDSLVRKGGYLGLYIASLYKIPDIFLLILEAWA